MLLIFLSKNKTEPGFMWKTDNILFPKVTDNSCMFIRVMHKELFIIITSNRKSCILGHMLLQTTENIVKTSSCYPQSHFPQCQTLNILYVVCCSLQDNEKWYWINSRNYTIAGTCMEQYRIIPLILTTGLCYCLTTCVNH